MGFRYKLYFWKVQIYWRQIRKKLYLSLICSITLMYWTRSMIANTFLMTDSIALRHYISDYSIHMCLYWHYHVFDVSYRSWLTEEAKERIPIANQAMYERIWDESDYVIPPSENNAFFVMTNVVMTANQTRTTCPEDPTEIPDVICGYVNETSGQVNITEGVCGQGEVFNLIKSHGNK